MKITQAKEATSVKGHGHARPVVYLVDGSGYIFRAYYALRRLSNSKGQPTNAVFNFATMLLRILKEHEPKHLAIAFDVGGKNFRHELYPEYKANRSAPPEDLPPQIPLIHQLVDTFRITKLLVKGVEADDVLGTAARQAVEAGYDVIIVTGDKDLMQLVDDRVSLMDEMRMGRGNEGSEVKKEQVIERFGVPPERVVDVLGLAGDSSDNVPGVDGIGEKTAAELVNQFGELEQVLARAAEIKQPSRRDKLLNQADRARLSKQLVTIKRDVDFPFSVDSIRYEGIDKDAARAFFHEMEFRRLINDPLIKPEAGEGTVPTASVKGGQGDLFASLAPAPQTPAIALDRTKYSSVTDEEALAIVLVHLKAAARFSVRTEVDKPGSPHARLMGVSVAWADGEAAFLSAVHLGVERLRQALAPLLSDSTKQIVAHDGKTDINTLSLAGWPDWQIAGDPMLASYLLDADAEAHTLDNVARRFLGHLMVDPDEVFGAGKGAVSFDHVSLEKQTVFSAEAADCTLRAANLLEPRVEQEGLGALYRDLELPLEHLLGKMEREGVRIDIGRLKGQSDSFVDEVKRIEEKAWAAAGRQFMLTSPQQIAELLFKELDLPVIKRTKTGPSTDSQVLEALSEKHEVPGLILEHRTLTKLKNTYLDVLPQLVDKNGRVHTHFNQAVAATGRLSSSDPNLQNIPIRTELGRKIRDAFVADEGCVLVSLDYSQIELRILAHVTDDPVLVDTFLKHEDVHRRTAAEIFDVTREQVTRDQRTAAKSINFGLLYGMGVVRLARELGIKRAEAKQYLDKYFERYAGVRRWHSEALEKAHVDREVRTLLGRRRKLPDLDSKNGALRARAERLAINTPIQGSAADIMKRAMIDADVALQREVPQARILLQVHDELVIEVPAASAPHALEVARHAMASAVTLKVPLIVDGKQGHTWNEAH